jgi:hypothetical protein
MIYTMRQAVLVSAVLLLPLTSLAQFEEKTPVVVHAVHGNNDTVGRELSYQVRERVKESSLYRLVAAKGKKSKKAFVYSLRIKKACPLFSVLARFGNDLLGGIDVGLS